MANENRLKIQREKKSLSWEIKKAKERKSDIVVILYTFVNEET